MKQTIIIVSIYVIALASSLTWIYTIGQQYFEPEAVEPIEKVVVPYAIYKSNPVALSFCRKTEFIVLLNELREEAFRAKVLEGLAMDNQIAKFDEKIDEMRMRIRDDVLKLKASGLEPPKPYDCDYIW